MRRNVLFFVLGSLATLGTLLTWRVMYPEAGDPKSIEYVMWRHGLIRSIDLEDVFRGMTSDGSRFGLVAGLNKQQLAKKFGYLRDADGWPGVGGCISQTMQRSGGTEGYGLWHSIWVVALKDGKAVALNICKG